MLHRIQNNECNLPMNGVVKVDAIIISDYCKGFLEEDDIKWICEKNKNVFVDTKKQLDIWKCKYHDLSVGEKPTYDLLICDKTKRIEEI